MLPISLQAGRDMNYGRTILHRFLRLLPAYMFTLVFLGWLAPHMGYGPYWSAVLSTARQW